MWCVRFVLSVCSLVMTRENLCVRFLNALLVVRLSFVVKLFYFCLKFSCRISFFRFVALFDFSNFVSNFEFVFSCRICRRNSRFVALFDFSNFEFRIRILKSYFRFVALFDFSNFDFSIRASSSSSLNFRVEFLVVFSFRCSIRLLEFRCSIRLLEFQFSIRISNSSTSIFSSSNFSSKFSFRCSIRLLEFRFEIVVEILIRKPNFLLLLSTDVSHLFSHVHSHFALVATRAKCALFVRKILVKRQFTFSLYFGIIEL